MESKGILLEGEKHLQTLTPSQPMMRPECPKMVIWNLGMKFEDH